MNLKIPRILLLFIGLSGLVYNCNSELEEEIPWDLDEYPDLLVVECILTNELKHQSVFLTTTGSYFNIESPQPVTAADVSVSDGINFYSFSESETIPGLYNSNEPFRGFPLKKYNLRINLVNPLNGVSSYEAESIMPEGIVLDSIICEIYSLPDLGFGNPDNEEEEDTTLIGIYYFGKEPDDPENYYIAEFSSKSDNEQPTAKEFLRFTDDFNNGSHSDFIFLVKNISGTDSISFEIRSVEMKFYDYIGSIQQMDQSGSAYSMSGPPANAEGNIPNALGYFSASFISKKTVIPVDMRK